MTRRTSQLLTITSIALLFGATSTLASMPTLSQQPRPATLRACEVWAGKQDGDALEMWGVQEDGGFSREIALSRLVSVCMGGDTPEIVGFGSSVGFDEAYCAHHRGMKICGSTSQANEAATQRLCVVNDPSPTPLNYRTAPYGNILGSFSNGISVSIMYMTNDQHGKAWAYVSDESGHPLGWVYRPYIECR